MKKLAMLLIVLAGMVLCQGCGTIMSGTTKSVHISSSPSGADFVVQVDKIPVTNGKTPQYTVLKRRAGFGKKYEVVFSKENYTTKTVPIKVGINGWYFGNIIFGGIPGMVIDLLDGACDDLKDVFVKLKAID